MRNLKDRLDRLEREAGEQLRATQCDNCRDWPSVCVTADRRDGSRDLGDRGAAGVPALRLEGRRRGLPHHRRLARRDGAEPGAVGGGRRRGLG